MSHNNDNLDIDLLKKKILYRSIYRGTRENDFLIKEFANFIFKDYIFLEVFQVKKIKEKNSFFINLEIFISKDDQEIFDILKNFDYNINKKDNSDPEKLFIEFYKNKLKNDK
jgi:antitoxin CptB